METVCPSPIDETVVKNTMQKLGLPDHLQYCLDGSLSLSHLESPCQKLGLLSVLTVPPDERVAHRHD
jgi:hypothetical protein